jgi:hypothetical protein
VLGPDKVKQCFTFSTTMTMIRQQDLHHQEAPMEQARWPGGLVVPVFERGDVVHVPLDPAVGREQRGTRPDLVLTNKDFNRLGDVLVAPIIQGGILRAMQALP